MSGMMLTKLKNGSVVGTATLHAVLVALRALAVETPMAVVELRCFADDPKDYWFLLPENEALCIEHLLLKRSNSGLVMHDDIRNIIRCTVTVAGNTATLDAPI